MKATSIKNIENTLDKNFLKPIIIFAPVLGLFFIYILLFATPTLISIIATTILLFILMASTLITLIKIRKHNKNVIAEYLAYINQLNNSSINR